MVNFEIHLFNMDPKTEAARLINTKSRGEVSTLSEQESTAIKIRKTNFVWISGTFLSQIEMVVCWDRCQQSKNTGFKKKTRVWIWSFFPNPSARTRLRRHLLNRSRDFFVPRTRASFAHSWAGFPPTPYARVRGDFLFPYVNSRGLSPTCISRSRRREYFEGFVYRCFGGASSGTDLLGEFTILF